PCTVASESDLPQVRYAGYTNISVATEMISSRFSSENWQRGSHEWDSLSRWNGLRLAELKPIKLDTASHFVRLPFYGLASPMNMLAVAIQLSPYKPRTWPLKGQIRQN